MKRVLVIACVAVLFMAAGIAGAQDQTNDTATLTAPFCVVPPVIDGQISAGEWDDGGVADGPWSIHNNADLVEAQFIPVVKVKYGIKGVYVLFDSPDTDPTSGGNYEWKGAVNGFSWTNYCTVYMDTTGGETADSWGFQAEPSMSALGSDAVNPLGNSYGYDGVGLYERLRTRWTTTAQAMADQEVGADEVVYWAGGSVWDFKESQVRDGLKADGSGFVMEWFIAYNDLKHGFYTGYIGEVDAEGWAPVNAAEDVSLTNADGTGPGTSGIVAPDHANSFVSGMPTPGTVWEMNFGADWGDDTGPRYYNWVGDSGGFATKPHGKVTFGAPDATAVRDAILYELGN